MAGKRYEMNTRLLGNFKKNSIALVVLLHLLRLARSYFNFVPLQNDFARGPDGKIWRAGPCAISQSGCRI